MKRKADDSGGLPSTTLLQRRRRQPQTSCDSCRQKKLKCDRGQPCGSCRIRGLACNTPPSQSPAADAYSPSPAETARRPSSLHDSIEERLAALERAVFRTATATPTTPPRSLPVSGLERERHQQTAQFLDSAYGKTKSLDLTARRARLRYCVASSHRQCVDDTTTHGADGPTWLMPREEALALLQDYVDNAYHLLPVLHMAAVRALVNKVYAEAGGGGTMNMNIDPAPAALIFSFCASSAFFWNRAVPCQYMFESDQDATQASITWLRCALESLEEVQRTQCGSTMEGAQAYAIASSLVYNVEGTSARLRLLHACSVAVCRELALHMVDGGQSQRCNSVVAGPEATREIKRRLWWHVTSTDWMLGLNGGPLDGTYTIHPGHMKVAVPRDLNDGDLSSLTADSTVLQTPDTPTQMTCFLFRIRLGEVCRAVVDAGLSDSSSSSSSNNLLDAPARDRDRVLALDRLFEHELAMMSPAMALDAPVPSGAPRLFCLQRATVHLGFHSRRARLHRPFLLSHDDSHASAHGMADFRHICVRSARTVLEVSMSLLEQSLIGWRRRQSQPQPPPRLRLLHHAGHEQCAGSPVHRLGVVINHLFMACAILAYDSDLRSTHNRQLQGDAVAAPATAADTELHDELAYARRLLAMAADESPLAADLVRGMTDIFTRYRISNTTANGTGTAWADRRPGGVVVNDVVEQHHVQGSEAQNGDDGGGDFGHVPGLDRLLDGFLDPTYVCNDWDQVIAELDSYCRGAA